MSQTITELSTRNFMGTKSISIQPRGSLVVLAGANGQGKSSFIRAFEEMLDPKGTRLTPKPIREGAEEAVVELITDTVRAVRTYRTNDAGKLEVFALDGAKYPSGKEFLAAATGGALFDPFEFVRLPEKAQRDQLLARVNLPFDLDDLARERAGAYEERTRVGRELKQLEGQLAGIPKPNVETPTEEVSAAGIIETIRAAQEVERRNSDIEHRRQRAADEIAEIETRIAEWQRKLEDAKTGYLRLDAEWQACITPADVSELEAQLAVVEQTNAAIREGQTYRKVAAALTAKRAEHDALDAKLDAVDRTKRDGLAAAKFPVDGLSVDESGITFNGIPFKQVNTAMQTAIAFNLATLPQPDLRLVVIKDGDSLDADSLAGIERIADERGYIVLVERDRDESREIGFTITEGVLA